MKYDVIVFLNRLTQNIVLLGGAPLYGKKISPGEAELGRFDLPADKIRNILFAKSFCDRGVQL